MRLLIMSRWNCEDSINTHDIVDINILYGCRKYLYPTEGIGNARVGIGGVKGPENSRQAREGEDWFHNNIRIILLGFYLFEFSFLSG